MNIQNDSSNGDYTHCADDYNNDDSASIRDRVTFEITGIVKF